MLEKVWRKCTPLFCWCGCKVVQPLWRTVWRFLKKLKIELPYDPAIPLLDIHLEKTIIQKDTCTAMFIAALFTIAKTWKQYKSSWIDECIKKCGIYTMEYYSAMQKEWNIAPTWMDLEIIILSQRKRNICYHLYVESKKNYLFTKQK